MRDSTIGGVRAKIRIVDRGWDRTVPSKSLRDGKGWLVELTTKTLSTKHTYCKGWMEGELIRKVIGRRDEAEGMKLKLR